MQLQRVADDIVIVDSGSEDRTPAICKKFKVTFITRPLDNFKNQRNFALQSCAHHWVLSLDSDEVPTDEFIKELILLKDSGFRQAASEIDAYRIQRRWFVLGKEVHNFYPSSCPDYPIRLFDKTRVSFDTDSNGVHETPGGFRACERMPGWVDHYCCESLSELMDKLNRYSSIAADDLRARNKKYSKAKIFLSPISAWLKWYIYKQGFRDGRVGLILAGYAARYSFFKYIKYHFETNGVRVNTARK